MVEIVKQSMVDIWASAGDVVMPDTSKIQEGWLVEVPPRQYWNWMQNRTDTNLAYIFQRGIPAWDNTVEYLVNKSFVVHNGVVYRALLTGTNQEPGVATTYWKRAFSEASAVSDAVSGLTPSADTYIYFTGASTATTASITSFARSILDDVDANAVRTTIGAQQADATLTALAGLTTSANKLPYFTGTDTVTTTDISPFGRSLIDDADSATARTTLGLANGATTTVGTIATQNSNSVSITGGSITGITDLTVADGGTGASDAAGARTNLGVYSTAQVDAADALKANKSGDTFTGNVVIPSINGGQLAGMRNKIINGKMEIAQRGTSLTAVAPTTSYLLDRWEFVNLSTAVCTISQQADAPANNEFQNSLRIAVTTAASSVAPNEVSAIQQKVEGFTARDLVGKTFTISFWVRSSKVGTHCVSLANSAGDRSYIIEYTVSAANTWEYKTITVPGGLITAGGWNWNTSIGVIVRWGLVAGSTFQTTPGAWQTGNLVATANQVNCLDTVGNIFAITGVQLEVGSVATPFEHRLYGAELALCQRYYEKSYDIDMPAGSLTKAGASTSIQNTAFLLAAGTTRFNVPKRATPTIAVYSCETGTANVLSEYDPASLFVADRSISIQAAKNSFYLIGAGTLIAGNFANFQWIANAEL